MYSTQDNIQHSETSHQVSSDPSAECADALALASGELRAFTRAIEELYGTAAAERGAAVWVEIAEAIEVPTIGSHQDWRKVTIQAASRLAQTVSNKTALKAYEGGSR